MSNHALVQAPSQLKDLSCPHAYIYRYICTLSSPYLVIEVFLDNS